MMKKWIVCILALLMILCVVGCDQSTSSAASSVVSAVESTAAAYDLSKYGNLPSNINNGGRCVAYDGKVYYCCSDRNNQIWYLDPVSGQQQLVSDKVSGYSLNIYAGILYGLTMDSNVAFSLDLASGSVADLNIKADSLLVYDGVLYAVTSSEILAYRLSDATSSSVYTGAASYLNAWDGVLYFVDADGSIQKLENGTLTEIANEDASYIVVNNGWIYYVDNGNDNALTKIGADGADKQVLSAYATGGLAVLDDGTIYYINNSAYRHITTIDVNGNNKTPINQEEAHGLQVAEGYVFYIELGSQQMRILKFGKKAADDLVK